MNERAPSPDNSLTESGAASENAAARQDGRRAWLKRVARCFHWRRKRFWLVTLPGMAVLNLTILLLVLVNVRVLKSWHLEIGSWRFAELRVQDGMHPGSGTSLYRDFRLGPLRLLGERHTLHSSGGPRGWILHWHAHPSNVAGAIGYGAGEWTAAAGFEWK